MPLPAGPGPHVADQTIGPWRVHLHAHQGNVRARIEDAWCSVADARIGGQRTDLFGVFDGLGGAPNGQQAAWAAANGLRDIAAAAAAPHELLQRLNEAVRPTGGSTTAAILGLARDAKEGPRRAWMFSVGDSSIYRADADGVKRLNPHDRVERHVLSDWLGRRRIGGHVQELAVQGGDAFALCTDGVDEVVGTPALRELLARRPADMSAALQDLFRRIMDAGAPDNATIIVVQPSA